MYSVQYTVLYSVHCTRATDKLCGCQDTAVFDSQVGMLDTAELIITSPNRLIWRAFAFFKGTIGCTFLTRITSL